MGMTMVMKMTFLLAIKSIISVATSEFPNLQTGVTNKHGRPS